MIDQQTHHQTRSAACTAFTQAVENADERQINFLKTVQGLQALMLAESASIEDTAQRRGYISAVYMKSIQLGSSLLKNLRFSSSLTMMMGVIAQKTAHDIFEEFGLSQNEDFSMMNIWEKKARLQYCLKLYFAQAAKFVPDLQTAHVRLGAQTGDLRGWVASCDIASLEAGTFYPVSLNKPHFDKAAFPDLVNTTLHEASHHLLLQMTSFHVRKDKVFTAQVQNDLSVIRDCAMIGFAANPLIYDLYRADPQEVLAFMSGDSIEKRLRVLLAARSVERAERRYGIEYLFLSPEDILVSPPQAPNIGLPAPIIS